MKKSKANQIIEAIARVEGIGINEVRAEMARAIDEGFVNSDEDVVARKFWGQWNGHKPTIEEFIVASNAEVLARLSRDNKLYEGVKI
jgi:hypothetical protein